MSADQRWERVHIPDWDAQQRMIRQAERLQSEALAEIVDRVFGGPWRWLDRHVVAPLRARARRRADIRALAALEPRLLADIGLAPADVEALRLGQLRLEDLNAVRRRARAARTASVVEFPAPQARPATETADERAA